MKKITKNELVKLLKGYRCVWAGMTCAGKQTVLNKGRGNNKMKDVLGIDPDSITKMSDQQVLVGTAVNYENLVNNRLLKEEKKNDSQLHSVFEAKELPWGHWEIPGLIIEHNGKQYLRCYCLSHNTPKVSYLLEGAEIDLKDEKFQPWKKPAKKDGENQGLENPIITRTYGLESIKEVRVAGETYSIA